MKRHKKRNGIVTVFGNGRYCKSQIDNVSGIIRQEEFHGKIFKL